VFCVGSRSPHGNGHFGGVEIFPYVVYQCSDWPSAAAVSCHVNPPPHKIPTLLTRCGLSSKLSVHSFSLLLLLLPVSNYSAIFRTLCLQQFYFDPPGITVFFQSTDARWLRWQLTRRLLLMGQTDERTGGRADGQCQCQ